MHLILLVVAGIRCHRRLSTHVQLLNVQSTKLVSICRSDPAACTVFENGGWPALLPRGCLQDCAQVDTVKAVTLVGVLPEKSRARDILTLSS